MLNRRILRIKAFKSLFPYAISKTSGSESVSLQQTLDLYDHACRATRDLYIFLLSSIPYMAQEVRRKLEALASMNNATPQDKNPNFKFADNNIARILSDDIDFRKALKNLKLSWEQYDIQIRHICASMMSKDYYRQYLEDKKCDISSDCRILSKVFEEEFVDNPEIETLVEDLNIWWADDLAYALGCCLDTFRDFVKKPSWSMPPLYRSENLKAMGRRNVSSDKDFSVKLLQNAYCKYDEFYSGICSVTKGWEPDRLVSTDVCIMIMCLAEVDAFPDIPSTVSLNEYIEISRYYSTPNSTEFVNGILNALVQNRQTETLNI